MDRRQFVKLGAASVAMAAVGGGVWVQAQRQLGQRASDVITGPWAELGGAQWLLPNLDDALMVVPDRPHSKEESWDPALRALVRRTRSFRVSTGEARLRSGDPAPKAADTLRIIAIGDSVTFGWGVTEAESWPAQLEQRLTERRRVEVINAGVPAQGLSTMARWVEVFGKALSPDLLILVRRPETQGGGSSHRDTVIRMRRALPETPIFVALSPLSRFDLHGIQVGHSEEAALKIQLGDTPVMDLTSALRSAQGETGWALKDVGGAVEAVDLATGEVGFRTKGVGRDPLQTLYTWADANPRVREALFFDEGHPDAAGLVVMAAAIGDWLRRYGVV